MAANRSRTDKWRDCLEQICKRRGGIELTPAHGDGDNSGLDLLLRVRLLAVNDQELVVEMPNAAGGSVNFEIGLRLIGVMSIGQNRWMFHTRVIASTDLSTGYGKPTRALRLEVPTGVERCQRRSFYRISSATLDLPSVTCWPLVNPTSVIAAETANRAMIHDLRASNKLSTTSGCKFDSLVLPDVGLPFQAKFVNMSGGGLGLAVKREESNAIEPLKMHWIALDLRPHVPAPLGMTTRIVHTHIDSGLNLYCGMSFEFSINPSHRAFVIEEIGRFISEIQRTRTAKKAA